LSNNNEWDSLQTNLKALFRNGKVPFFRSTSKAFFLIMNQIEIKPQEFGIEPKKANELIGNLPQIKAERDILQAQFYEVIKLDIEDPKTTKQAKELRLLIQKNRTQGIQVWHKTTKDFFLKGGQFVDAIKRMEIAINERMEIDLEQIEKYAENKERERLDELESKRLEILEPFKDFVPFGANIRTISDEDFNKILNGAKLQQEAKIEAEKKAEAERIEQERLAEIARIEREKEIEAQRIENERLKKEAEAKEKQLELERKKAREEADRLEAIRQFELKKEREKQAKLEAELKAKKDAENEAEKQRLAKELEAKKEAEKLAKAPIKKQLGVWVDSFELPKTEVHNETSKEIIAKFEAYKKWAISRINEL
jgi:colicin import membrane protein